MTALRAVFAVLLLWTPWWSTVHAALPEFTRLVKDVGPSVVNISTTQKARSQELFPGMPMDPNDPRNEFFRRFFGSRRAASRRPARWARASSFPRTAPS
jgi:Trypsin-like serine proteases, typically periplasmic, contain C-terminal PDZ domain